MVRLNIDGEQREVPEGTPLFQVAPKNAIVARLGEDLVDLARAVRDEDEAKTVAFPEPGSSDALHVLRHSAAHVMAQAVVRVFPDAKYAVGPPVENGFYYDFELPRPLTEEDLPEIEKHFAEIVKADQRFSRDEVPRDEAIRLFTSEVVQPFKTELLTGGEEEGQVKIGETATIYRNTERGSEDAPAFTDLCLGPHVPSTRYVKHTKLLRVSGAYWRGDVERPQLQRIYGTAWATAEDLAEHLHRLEEAERRDHRRLGRELDLFSSPAEAGAGLFVWHPKGGLLRKLVEDFSRDEHMARGYEIVATPHIGRSVLWETSGHLEKFAENMYPAIGAEEGDYYLKPMNCPFHILIYKSRTRSYRDLPLRFSELGTVYRHEMTGTLHGLLRVRGLTQDDSHIFCRPDQLTDELLGVMEFTEDLYNVFGFSDPVVHLSTNPGKAIGSPEMWEQATSVLRQALDQSPYDYEVAEGEGAFYGPKIDFHFRDAIGRVWQLTTIQVDFALPERFGIEYIGADNAPHRPVMVHRALFGSVERFIGVLVEHTAGAIPPWIAPVQVRVIPLNDDLVYECRTLAAELVSRGLRAEVDAASESVNYKIRRGTLEKVPWMLVVGKREIEAGTVSVRTRNGTDTRGVPLDDFIQSALRAVGSRDLDVG